MRKKLMALLLAASMVVGMTACGSNKNGGSSTNSAQKFPVSTMRRSSTEFKYKRQGITKVNIELTYYHFDQDETVQYLADPFPGNLSKHQSTCKISGCKQIQ